MKKQFIERVLRELIVDTRTYRHIVRWDGNVAKIFRIPLAYLDTTAAIDGWEFVAEVR